MTTSVDSRYLTSKYRAIVSAVVGNILTIIITSTNYIVVIVWFYWFYFGMKNIVLGIVLFTNSSFIVYLPSLCAHNYRTENIITDNIGVWINYSICTK